MSNRPRLLIYALSIVAFLLWAISIQQDVKHAQVDSNMAAADEYYLACVLKGDPQAEICYYNEINFPKGDK